MNRQPVQIFILMTALFLSCSRALSDLGYPAGNTRTVDPTNVGNNTGDRMLSGEDNIPRIVNFSDRENTTSMWNVNTKQAQEEVNRQCKVFLTKFYSDLNAENFNQKKFVKKYKKYMSDSVRAGINNNGVQMFLDSSTQRGENFDITPMKGRWFAIKGTNKNKADLLIKVKKSNPMSKILIMGVVNPEKNIKVIEMSPAREQLILISD